MSDPVLRARLADVAASLHRAQADVEAISAGLTDGVRYDPLTPIAPVWVVALPFYWCTDRERATVTRRVFRHYRNIADQLGVRVTGIGSEGAVSRGLWCEYFDEIDYREYPQTFTANNGGSDGLRGKFDETIRATRHLNPDRVFIGGSDDLIPVDWYAKAFQSEADLVGVTGGAVIVQMDRAMPVRSCTWDGIYPNGRDVEFCGGGLVLSRKLLEAWGWAPFGQPGDEVGIERAAREQGFTLEGIAGRFFAVKCKRVLNPYAIAGKLGAAANHGGLDDFRRLWDALR